MIKDEHNLFINIETVKNIFVSINVTYALDSNHKKRIKSVMLSDFEYNLEKYCVVFTNDFLKSISNLKN